jgi:hypothetical protein
MPFTTQQFFEVFRRYNEAVWPAQVVLLGIGLAAAYLAFRARPGSSRFVVVVLAVLWLWMGVVYHLGFFRAINPAASVFGVLSVLQGFVLLRAGFVSGGLKFQPARDWRGIAGAALLVYGFLLYPLLGRSFGHSYPASPTFGLPCPTTIVTLGLMLWVRRPVPVWVLVIPLAWTVVGSSAAFRLGVPADLGLGVAGLVVLVDVVLGLSATGADRTDGHAGTSFMTP